MKHSFGKISAILAASALALALPLSACAAAEQNRYEVSLITATAPAEKSATTEVLADIRPSVVDVTSYTETGASAGSGVIIAYAGEESAPDEYYAVTNHHVIDGGISFAVDVLTIAEDGSESTTVYPATLVGSSFTRDIAVLAIRPPQGVKLSVASFIADSDTVKVGTEVLAIGNPLGILGGTVTHGIVSATKRDVSVSDIGTMTLMQTDASINGGNSGGGLFDVYGNLVGIINSGYDTYNGQNVEGLNFAIPANDARYAATQLIETHEESGGEVTQYGYVLGDARIDLSFSSAVLYTSSSLNATATYLIAAAASAESPLYAEWGQSPKAIDAVTVNGERTSFAESGSSSYSLTAAARALFRKVQADDEICVEYRDIAVRTTGSFFGRNYQYVAETAEEFSFTAAQYVYVP